MRRAVGSGLERFAEALGLFALNAAQDSQLGGGVLGWCLT
jgi:hypothetical protein